MRGAALDLGSNTLRLLVAESLGSDWRPLARGLATPRLGRGLVPGGWLSLEAKEAARGAALRFVGQARDLGAGQIALAATQACRLAADGEDFVAQLGRDLGLSAAQVISGEQEARLSRLGVLSRLEGPVEGAFLADIGGGSTELLALDDPAARPTSLPLGAVSLSEAHLAGDPPRPRELAALAAAVEAGLAPADLGGARRLVATAGTAATLAAIRLGSDEYRPDETDNFRVSRAQLDQEYAHLAAMPLAQRREVPGLEPARADIILGGLAILRGLMKVMHLEGLTVMDAGLLEGIFLHYVASR